MSYCCERFEKYTTSSEAHGHGSPALHQADDDGSWNVFGCCGGECYMVTDLRFCPWCGTKIEEERDAESEAGSGTPGGS